MDRTGSLKRQKAAAGASPIREFSGQAGKAAERAGAVGETSAVRADSYSGSRVC